jgi:hypothetical protein
MRSRRSALFLTGALLATVSGGCAMQDVSRNVYEGARQHNESLRGTPRVTSAAPSMSYDEYDKARSSAATPKSQ